MFHGATTLLQYYSLVYTTRNFLAKFTSLGYVAATLRQCCTAMTFLALTSTHHFQCRFNISGTLHCYCDDTNLTPE